jgi:hypothetical protein
LTITFFAFGLGVLRFTIVCLLIARSLLAGILLRDNAATLCQLPNGLTSRYLTPRSWFAPTTSSRNEHTDEDGAIVFQHAC